MVLAHVRVDFWLRQAFVIVDQASNTENPNDVSRRCRHIAAAKHGTIIAAMMKSLVVPKR